MLQFSITQLSNVFRFSSVTRCAQLAILIAVCATCMSTGVVHAQQLTSGSSGKQFRQEGIAAVPFQLLNKETAAKLKPVLDKPSLYRRLPKMAIECDQDYFRFLIRYPEVIVEIWKLMGVTKMDSSRVGPYRLASDDGAGTLSDLELVYGDGKKHIYYGNGTGHLLPALADLPVEVLSVDWRLPLSHIRNQVGEGKVLQGNLDPGTLLAPPEVIRQRTQEMIEDGRGGAHIANLGHGIWPMTPVEHAQAFVDAVQETPVD